MLVFHGVKVYFADGWKERLSSIGLSPEMDWAQLEIGQLVRRSTITKCFRICLADGHVVYFKRYTYFTRRSYSFLLPSKSVIEAAGYAELDQLGIPTLEVIACGEMREFGVVRAAFVVTLEIPNSQNLEVFARNVWYFLEDDKRQTIRRSLAIQVLDQVRVAHQAGFFHHDLKWRNILVQKQDDGGYLTVWIDCPRSSWRPMRRYNAIVNDLSDLSRVALSYFGCFTQFRMIKYYLGDGHCAHDAKKLFFDVKKSLARHPPKPVKLPDKKDSM